MIVEKDLWNGLNMTEEKFKSITEHVRETVKKYGENITYDDFEASIKTFNHSTTGEAKIIIGLFASRGLFLNIIESWENIPLEVESLLQKLCKTTH